MMLLRWYWILAILFSACTSQRYLNNQIHQAETDFKDHIGFVLYDPDQHKTIYDHQGDRYFTPASNTKIFTFYASLQILGDSIPALRYQQRNDSLIFWGTGNPGFLYGEVTGENKTFNFLKGQGAKLFFSSSNFKCERFGPGWSWDDYPYYYQAERTPFPIYGNLIKVSIRTDTIRISPEYFNGNFSRSPVKKEKPDVVREQYSNRLTFFPASNGKPGDWTIPFYYSDELLTELLTDTLKKEVKSISVPYPKETKTIYSIVADSLYKEMMQESDNFIAEQLLLLCAGKLSDTLRTEIAIDYVKKKFLNDLPDEPIWVDGSGLSRLNLFTPRSIVSLWERIYKQVPRERLFNLLAIGGRTGTLKNYYKAEKPYVFGKTGSLSNNHILSGYLVTKRGRTLIFSWMNNNFTRPSREVRTRMETVIKTIYEKY